MLQVFHGARALVGTVRRRMSAMSPMPKQKGVGGVQAVRHILCTNLSGQFDRKQAALIPGTFVRAGVPP